MWANFIITGIIIGFIVSMPIGPIGVLIIQRTVNKSRKSGLISGLGASLADAIFATIAGYSLSFIIDFIKAYDLTFQIVSAIAVLGLGLHIFLKNPMHDLEKYKRKGHNHFQDLYSAFLLTLANPFTLFALIAIFASSGIAYQLTRPSLSLLLVTGVFVGAFIWWLLLTKIVSLFKHRLNLQILWWVNKISGTIIIIFVLIALTVSLVTFASAGK